MKQLIQTRCNASGAGGHQQVTEVAAALLKPYAEEVHTDAIGNQIF